MLQRVSVKEALLPVLIFLLTLGAHYAWFVKTGSARVETTSSDVITTVSILFAGRALLKSIGEAKDCSEDGNSCGPIPVAIEKAKS